MSACLAALGAFGACTTYPAKPPPPGTPLPACGNGTCDIGETCETCQADCGQCDCLADCSGTACGPDPMCGASCGTCQSGEMCSAGSCVCAPDCSGLECGLDPVCGQSCGDCTGSDTCSADGKCIPCVPDCTGLACGPDPVCGASCGDCTGNDTCSAAGQCECVPACTGMDCGTESNCNTSCGTCGSGTTCFNGTCVVGATMCLNLPDACNDGYDIEYRYFDSARNLVYPGASTEFTVSYGSTDMECLLCTPGDNICLGAFQPTPGKSWGVGAAGTGSCTDCCYTCVDGQTNTYSDLTCP